MDYYVSNHVYAVIAPFQEQIQRAIFSNNLVLVKHILDLDTEDILSIRDKHNGSTVLHYAAYCGSPDIVTYLLG